MCYVVDKERVEDQGDLDAMKLEKMRLHGLSTHNI